MLIPVRLYEALSPPNPLRRPLRDWRLILEDDFDLAGPFLHPENARPSREVLCEHSCCAKRRLAVFQDGGQCLSTCQAVGMEAYYEAIPIADALLHRLDVPGLLGAMTTTWNVRPGGETQTGIHDVWRLGRVPSLNAPLYFLRPPTPRDTASLLARLMAASGDVPIFLVPTPRFIDEAADALIASRPSRIYPLEEAFGLDGSGQWQALATPDGNRESTPSPRYAFICEGKTWRVIFDGEASTFDHSRGCLAISYLLEQPRQVIPPLYMDALMRGNGAPPALPSGIAVTDGNDDLEMESQIAALQTRIDGDDPADAAVAREDLSALEAQRKKDHGLGGRSRRTSDSGDAARKNIGRLLTIAIEAMRVPAEAAWRHFRDSISPNSFSLAYRPAIDISWVVDRRKALKK